MARYYIYIREYDAGTEVWCEDLGKWLDIINELKKEGRLKIAKIYRYQGRKKILEKVIK